ncbi:hypothetical protein C9J03_11945 [Photobacterium gaetbulicola]|uniref:N-acetyltransferase domain-containing protein n=1 Tax=Photobacterium gaetbulicola Gung47 TaxID=658445 RepID=A0A0C5WNI8_9GAMM|nr:hypothetical protein [Photobacterium gaetbulicola]AJR08668.1 hypothetical protein H744_2c2004 [Photobacterium gaetbulicola Gung47]PSU10295.1 hypothetical protein C9J03_11945 [Photobacterium gaetbulicola]
MQFCFISPEHPDYSHHIRRLGAAFDDAENPEKEYREMKEQLAGGTLSLYHAKDSGVDLSIVGEADGQSYYVWGVAGVGFKAGIQELIRRIKLSGFKSVTCATAKQGIRRMYRYFGRNAITEVERLSNGKFCTWHKLEV